MNRRTQAEFWLERLNQAWEAVIPLGKLETYEDQETLRVEGCRFFHLLLEGNIDMVSLSGTGKEWTLFQAGPLCLINDIPAITGIDNHVRYICCGQSARYVLRAGCCGIRLFFAAIPIWPGTC